MLYLFNRGFKNEEVIVVKSLLRSDTVTVSVSVFFHQISFSRGALKFKGFTTNVVYTYRKIQL